jgi:hypothetical protein
VSVFGFVVGLLVVTMIAQAVIAAVITLGITLGVVAGVALALPAGRAMLSRMFAQNAPRLGVATSRALTRITRR